MGKRKEVPEEIRQEIIRRYIVNKEGRASIGKSYGLGEKVIKRILDDANVEIHHKASTGGPRKFNINDNFFKTQTHDMAYILGMLASDGCVARNENQVYIELQRSDREILEKINKILENEREVKDYETGRGYENSKLYFYSATIKKDLVEFHIIPNKTYDSDFKFPETLREEFYWDYIRGLFDGDGSVKMTGQSLTWQIDSSSKDIAETIVQFLETQGIKVGLTVLPKQNIDCYRAYAYGENAKKIFEAMYNTTSIYMERKHRKYLSLVK